MLKRLRHSWDRSLLALTVFLFLCGGACWGTVGIESLYDITYRTTDGTKIFPGVTIIATTTGDITATSYFINIPAGSTLQFVNDTSTIEKFGDLASSVSTITRNTATELQVTFSSASTAAGQFVTLHGVQVTNSGTASTGTSLNVSLTSGGAAQNATQKKIAVSADTLASASASQVDGSGTTSFPYPDMTINALAGTAITTNDTTGDIRIRIPSAASLEWDASAAITISGDASSKVGAISYPSAEIMRIDVTSAFAASDSITLSGAKFANEQGINGQIDWLELILNGTGGTVSAFDLRPFYVDAAMTVTYDGSTIGTTTTGGETSMGGVTIKTGTRTLTVGSYTGDLYLFLPVRDDIRFNRSITSWTPTISVNGSSFTAFSLGGILDDNGSGLGRVLYIDLTSGIAADSTVVVSGMKVENTGAAIATAHIGIGITGPNQIDAAHSNVNSAGGGSGASGKGNPGGDCFIATGARGRDLLILGFLAAGCAGSMLLAYLLRRARS